MARAAILALACGLACASTVGAADAWTGEAEAALVTDYRWRGLSLSEESPSLQLEATAWLENGAWASGGVNAVSEALGDTEIGLGVGYDANFATLDWSIGATGYIYPDGEELDYAELEASVRKDLGPVSLSAGLEYVPEQTHYAEPDTYVWVGFGLQISRLHLHAQIGHDNGLIEADRSTTDYSLGVGLAFGRYGADLTFVESEAAESAWLLRLSRSFSTSR